VAPGGRRDLGVADLTPSATAIAQTGTVRTRHLDGAPMVYVPAGEFRMGSDSDQARAARELCRQYAGDVGISVCKPEAFANEKPAHDVVLDGFWLDQHEITNGQYRACVLSGACQPPVDSSSFTRDSYYDESAYAHHPVIWVRWDQANAYCEWAGARLPSEAEWEYAARGPRGLLFPWGDTFDGRLLNYCDVGCAGVSDPSVDDGFRDTAPVGSFPGGESWCGALDMAGNVREWVADRYGLYSSERQANPSGPTLGESHIPRGGSWYDTPDDVRSANRGENTADYARHKVGFRCASSIAP
jgi:formylglycine-generating enzyme required for sulfatase activity